MEAVFCHFRCDIGELGDDRMKAVMPGAAIRIVHTAHLSKQSGCCGQDPPHPKVPQICQMLITHS